MAEPERGDAIHEDEPFNTLVRALQPRLSAAGLPVPTLTLARFPSTGRGLMATRDIDPGQAIVSIPHKDLITVATLNPASIRTLELPEHLLLTVWILITTGRHKFVDGHEPVPSVYSYENVFCTLLPRSFETVAMTWKEEWVNSLFGKSTSALILHRRSELLKDFELLSHALSQAKELELANLATDLTYQRFEWSWMCEYGFVERKNVHDAVVFEMDMVEVVVLQLLRGSAPLREADAAQIAERILEIAGREVGASDLALYYTEPSYQLQNLMALLSFVLSAVRTPLMAHTGSHGLTATVDKAIRQAQAFWKAWALGQHAPLYKDFPIDTAIASSLVVWRAVQEVALRSVTAFSSRIMDFRNSNYSFTIPHHVLEMCEALYGSQRDLIETSIIYMTSAPTIMKRAADTITDGEPSENKKQRTETDARGADAVTNLEMGNTEVKPELVQEQGQDVDHEMPINPDPYPLGGDDGGAGGMEETGGTVNLSTSSPQVDTGARFKLQLGNVYKFSNRSDVENFCKKNGVKTAKVKKIPSLEHALLTFLSESEMIAAMEALQGKEMKGRAISVSILGVNTFNRRKPAKNDQAPEDDRSPAERLADQVTPLWRKSYQEQLVTKSNDLKRILGKRGFVSELQAIQKARDGQVSDLEWLETSLKANDGLPCPFLDIVPSPVTESYRTKCEFSVGRNLSQELTVGFLLGGFRDGDMAVMDPSETKHVSKPALALARIMQSHVRESEYPPYERKAKSGVWRLFVCKTFLSGENMLVVQIDPRGLSEEERQLEKSRLRHRFVVGASEAGLKLTSLMYQEWSGVFDGFTDKAPLELLEGQRYVHEVIRGIKFRISPFAFFQVNTPATEILYGIISDWCGLSIAKDTIVLDLCCGTGTIGLILAALANKVYGVEIVADAIADAQYNARINGITNVEYMCGKVENVVPGLMKRLAKDAKLVAVLDPPREGVHASVIEAIRGCADLKHVVYVACNAAAAAQNFVALCRPTSNKYKGKPFQLLRAQPVDMFPHSKPVELILEFRRDQPSRQAATVTAFGQVTGVSAGPRSNADVGASTVSASVPSGGGSGEEQAMVSNSATIIKLEAEADANSPLVKLESGVDTEYHLKEEA
ncbi:tRNA methyltransferase 2 [Gonapodya sp. JEL0774]|nr:tRNA methyltransferase 2 [Gonapodya sp. JEL0774]